MVAMTVLASSAASALATASRVGSSAAEQPVSASSPSAPSDENEPRAWMEFLGRVAARGVVV